ncbi:hypothetical protein BT63DRAFT_427509 [Microthyrium microscopicum]|uniref:Acyltransferase MbtK/IucB-like conserved domain-containing protein n=1 Tax=Microthyrium microscopicum TaxID=703497 RepID=A0A6A6U686_9PEZI|nr:hypothetical protein BT63DRAFT_427509 [Microthyrium microscopicum]
MALLPESSSQAPLKSMALAKLALPHPFLTEFLVVPSLNTNNDGSTLLQIRPAQSGKGIALSSPLHRDDLHFTVPQATEHSSQLDSSDNTQWARSQRASRAIFWWETTSPPTTGQIWLIVYALLIMKPELEVFRVELSGHDNSIVATNLKSSSLAHEHPRPHGQDDFSICTDLIISRSAFWQGAASPFGARSAWTPSSRETINVEATDFTITTRFPDRLVHQRHPRRPHKPTPNSVVYSRYIPSLDEHFSLIALDYENEKHVQLFHKWQNDPRVAQGWKETGTLEEHRTYLKKQNDDPHTLTVFGRFNDTCFSYFEIYWAKEDHVGAHYNAGDFDRGRHSLVGDARYRGRHRVLAWWSCIVHYIFLDDHRTDAVIGEPLWSNDQVLIYDYTHGFHLVKYIDFPHKRAALVQVSRERFFQISPLTQKGGFVAGTGLPLPARL